MTPLDVSPAETSDSCQSKCPIDFLNLERRTAGLNRHGSCSAGSIRQTCLAIFQHVHRPRKVVLHHLATATLPSTPASTLGFAAASITQSAPARASTSLALRTSAWSTESRLTGEPIHLAAWSSKIVETKNFRAGPISLPMVDGASDKAANARDQNPHDKVRIYCPCGSDSLPIGPKCHELSDDAKISAIWRTNEIR